MWDIRFEGFLIRANFGASGGAGHLVAPPQDVPFASLELTALRALPNQAFGQDALGGPFGAFPWYKYNVTGSDLQICPNFNVYLIKKGDAVYKVVCCAASTHTLLAFLTPASFPNAPRRERGRCNGRLPS